MNALLDLITLPVNPPGRGLGRDWSLVERQLGTHLPLDYQQYINLCGTAPVVDDFLVIYSPFSDTPYLNLLTQEAEWSAALRTTQGDIERKMHAQGGYVEIKNVPPQDPNERLYPYPAYPEPNGLLAWGSTTNFGDVMFWQTGGSPETWTVVMANLRDGEFEHHPLSMTDFLVLVLTGRIESSILPRRYLAKKRARVDNDADD